LVVIVRLVDVTWPVSNRQLKVNTNEGLLEASIVDSKAPGITKLMTRGEVDEGSRVSDTGERDNEDRSIEGSSIDQVASPLDFRSMVPITFSLAVGLTLIGVEIDPTTDSFNKGDSEAKITVSKILSHWRLSPAFPDRPRNSTLNTSPSLTVLWPSDPDVEEELTLISSHEEEKEGVRSRRPSQVWRYEGEIRKQLQSNNRARASASTSPTTSSS
jgi:hypothetical protein